MAFDNLLPKHFKAMGIVHKDIKSDNVRFARRNGKMYLTFVDFGVAEYLGDGPPIKVRTA